MKKIQDAGLVRDVQPLSYFINARLTDVLIIINHYNNHKKIFQNPLTRFFKKLYNFDDFIRRRLSDHNKITFAIKYLPMSHLR